RIPWVNSTREYLDRLQYGWRRWVLGYDEQTRSQLLQRLPGGVAQGGWYLLLWPGGLMALAGALAYWRRRRHAQG
ncbi:MAG: hypothetical protein KDI15_08175, partial [Thiothrix sp.]|nr:hypothetical protein [Thiothrix sp.]